MLKILTVTWESFLYTFSAIFFLLFVFLYDTSMMTWETTETCRWITYDEIYFTGVYLLVCYTAQIFFNLRMCNA